MSCSAIRPGWNPLSIALMVLGFIVFWPLGLAMLAYILWGDRLKDMAAEVSGNVRRATDRLRSQAVSGSSGNVAFDEYRARELARLEEERRKLDEQRAALDAEVEEFQAFVRELRRAKDQAEFDRYMAERERHRAERDRGAEARGNGNIGTAGAGI